jgi:hypothetical protein
VRANREIAKIEQNKLEQFNVERTPMLPSGLFSSINIPTAHTIEAQL